MTFQVGEKLVYPNHGVATVENVSSRAFDGHNERFYLLRLSATSLTVMVPFSHAEHVGLRRVTKNGEMAKVIDYLGEQRKKRPQDWKDRFRNNTERMQKGSLIEVAEVLKSLLVQQNEKPLSFREKKMLDRARHMLITELSTSRGLKDDDAARILDQALCKTHLHFPERM